MWRLDKPFVDCISREYSATVKAAAHLACFDLRSVAGRVLVSRDVRGDRHVLNVTPHGRRMIVRSAAAPFHHVIATSRHEQRWPRRSACAILRRCRHMSHSPAGPVRTRCNSHQRPSRRQLRIPWLISLQSGLLENAVERAGWDITIQLASARHGNCAGLGSVPIL